MKKAFGTPLWVAALLDKGLSAVEFRVWLYLNWRQGTNGTAWPSQDAIADELGMTAEGVRKIIGRLTEKGWLRVTRPTHTGPGMGLLYETKHPNGCLAEHPNRGSGEHPNRGSGEHPNSHTGITPTAKPRHKGRTHTRTHTDKAHAVSYTPAFERFWTKYPRKLGKAEAFQEWQAINPDDTLAEKIILAVQAWKRSEQWTKDGGKFIVYPVRFLKYRRSRLAADGS